jgi:aminoacyl tRNA synthase complex-interacting multifunctional protein 1
LIPSVKASDTHQNPLKLNTTLFPNTIYTPADIDTISTWLERAFSPEATSSTSTFASDLNTHLTNRTSILGAKPSIADLAVYAAIAPQVALWSSEQRTGERGLHHVVRFVDYVQNAPVYGLNLKEDGNGVAGQDGSNNVPRKVMVDVDEVLVPLKPLDPKAEKERRKKEAAAAKAGNTEGDTTVAADKAGKNGGKEKGTKEKVKDKIKDAAASAGIGGGEGSSKKKGGDAGGKKKTEPQVAAQPSPTMVDLRVGHILRAEQHPAADKLYVSTIAMGDPAGTENTSEYTPPAGGDPIVVRTVCSGLAGLIPLADMQDRLVVVVANLKPVNMRSVKSCAMVLCASPRPDEGATDAGHDGPVELVVPPKGAKAGDRVWFEGWEGEPEKVLNPKKKIFETVAPGFVTTEACEVAFERKRVEGLKDGEGSEFARLKSQAGICTVPSLKSGIVR